MASPEGRSAAILIHLGRRRKPILPRRGINEKIAPAGFLTGTRPLDPDNWHKRRFLPTLERAGLRRVRLHALRHTYASLLINQGESIKYVSRQLGHASIQITADLYGHLFRETSVAAMRRLGDTIPSSKHPPEPAETFGEGSSARRYAPGGRAWGA